MNTKMNKHEVLVKHWLTEIHLYQIKKQNKNTMQNKLALVIQV